MFSNAYQNGPHVEVFDSKVNKDKNELYAQLYKASPANNVKKEFDKQIKSYLFELQGQTTKLSFPKDDHKELCLVQQYLVLQILIPQGFPWSIELTLTDTSKTKRRVNISTGISKSEVKYFHVKQPLDHRIKRNTWLNLAIDCYSYMAAWKGQTYRSLDQITIGACCKLRRIFTMRQRLVEFSNDDESFQPSQMIGGVFVPKNLQLNSDVLQCTQVISYDPAEPAMTSMKESSVASMASTSVKTTKKQPSIHDREQKKTIPARLYIPEPPVAKVQQHQKPQHAIQTNTIKKPPIKGIEKHHPIPQHKEDEQSDELHNANQLKKQLARYDHKKQKFEPIGRAKKVFLSDAQQGTLSVSSKKKEVQPPKIQLVKVKDFEENRNYESAEKEKEVDFNYEDEAFDDSLQKEQVLKIESQLVKSKERVQKLHSMFPTSTITKKNKETIVVEVKDAPNLQLVYDDVLDCYYDPKSNTYYTIQ